MAVIHLRPMIRPSNEFRDAAAPEQGFALLAVLGFLLLFSLVLGAFAAAARLDLLTAQNSYARTRLASAAEALDAYLAWRLGTDKAFKADADRGQYGLQQCRMAPVSFAISLVPHAGLINLNAADKPLLISGLKQTGLDDAEADAAAEEVLQYRSPQKDPADPGPESGLKHAPFEDLVELHELRHLQTIPLRLLSRLFSVVDGMSVLPPVSQALPPSRTYTIQAALFDDDGWAERAAIFAVGEGGGRLANLAYGDSPERPVSVEGCSALDATTASILAKTFER
jgi:hypothetical protein